jgi:uncharacterized protein YdhG (YjbR/CyaY superfamily)
MAMQRYGSVSEYIAAQPRAVQGVLRRVRGAIRKAVPAAEESISYGIPTFKLNGRVVIYFAAWKEHYSIYPSSARLVAALPELSRYEMSKGTIRMPLDAPVPLRLIARIARFRAKEAAAAGPTRRRAAKR